MTDENRILSEQDIREGAWVRVKRGIRGDKRAPVVKVLDGDILVLIDGKMTRVHRTDAELVPVRVMDELDKELHDLGKAERDIVDGEERVAQQMLRLEELRRDGHDTKDAEDILATMQKTLALFRDHRQLILAEIGRLNANATREH